MPGLQDILHKDWQCLPTCLFQNYAARYGISSTQGAGPGQEVAGQLPLSLHVAEWKECPRKPTAIASTLDAAEASGPTTPLCLSHARRALSRPETHEENAILCAYISQSGGYCLRPPISHPVTSQISDQSDFFFRRFNENS